MSSKDASLYGEQKPRKLAGGKEISSSTTLSFTSQLSSLINNSDAKSNPKPTASRSKPKKEDIFTTHNRNTAKRAKRDLEDTPAFEQKHSTKSDALDLNTWERSKRKMEEKARLYAAMKRGDVEDVDEKYAVDFDKKWTDRRPDEEDSEQDDDEDDVEDQEEEVEYVDEFGRTRTGTRTAASRTETTKNAQASAHLTADRFTARPSAPASLIHGDTIQHLAFSPSSPHAVQMDTLARKRDTSLTPPPETHFDSGREIRTKGTGFFQFSGDVGERRRQMEGLERERRETERVRGEKREGSVVGERKRRLEERRREIGLRRGKRKAEDFLERLGTELEGRGGMEGGGDESRGEGGGGGEGDEGGTGEGIEMMERIQDAVRREKDHET
ncbi:hypothetical protein KC343_g4788 [Hortaea werneckii]|uniref:DUF4078 domain-containing protein n=1 Tax=Hortaea werneckii TaxID=91943 RepID=A0A3M7HL14_HORWE|nr:hypothetical protein KC346_g4476 [Hortaea werneckii]KAI7630180.1 hypothetical protein KC343_g4788 [Hortaea werneckii]KAI7676368.1 hypothetical protein KC319_g4389 [Hortaea werneckii]KAI7710043.1 hypothetical protein KC322_g4526 [Hortaea werneckii]RMZ13735.1 hypothetical protein D0864_00369 [Hortaea werneckii]